MTGYTVHTGSNAKFTAGFDRIFGGAKQGDAAKKAARASGRKTVKAAKKKKAAKK